MQPFVELGTLVENRWREQNYREESLPAIASHALSEANLCDRVDPLAIIRWIHNTSTVPVQMDLEAKFGNPPITLFVGPRFYIDAYYWLDGTTAIHQHAFSGAFQVLSGSSVHAGFSFEIEHEVSPHFIIGKLKFRDVSLLQRGDIRQINPGPEFIHSLFHLERPSVTITIRTFKAPDFARQYSYFKPSVAINPYFVDAVQTKRVQTVSLLLRSKTSEADKLIGDLIEGSDFHTCYLVLSEAFDFLCHRELEEIVGVTRSHGRFLALLDRARKKHGKLVDVLEPVFEEAWRQAEIIWKRAEVKNEDHRFLLALLLNVPERVRILELVKQKYPGENAIDLTVNWFRELAISRTFGSRDANVLGKADLGDRHFFVLKKRLGGQTIEQIQLSALEEFETLADGRTVEEITAELEAIPMLRNILS